MEKLEAEISELKELVTKLSTRVAELEEYVGIYEDGSLSLYQWCTHANREFAKIKESIIFLKGDIM